MIGNHIIELPDEMRHCAEMTHLNVRGNPLTRLPIGLAGMSCLVELNAIDCNVEFIPDELFHLSVKTFERFWIPNSTIPRLPRSLYDCINLIELDCTNNAIVEITEDLDQMVSLKYLYLSNNEIPKMPNTISALQDLEILELDNNRLKEVPIEIKECQNLYRLTIHKNKFKEPQFQIRNLPRLEDWNVSDNKYNYSEWLKFDLKEKADAEKLEAAKMKQQQAMLAMAMDSQEVSLVGIEDIERGITEGIQLREEAIFGKDKQHSVLDEPWDDEEPRDYEAKVRWNKARKIREKRIKEEKEAAAIQAKREAAIMVDMFKWHDQLYDFYTECIHECPPDYPTEQFVLEHKLNENAVDRDLMRTDEARRTTRSLENLMIRVKRDNPMQDVKALVNSLRIPNEMIKLSDLPEEFMTELKLGQEFQFSIEQYDIVLRMIFDCGDSTRSVEMYKEDKDYLKRLSVLEANLVDRILTAATAKGVKRKGTGFKTSGSRVTTRGGLKTSDTVGSNGDNGRKPPVSPVKTPVKKSGGGGGFFSSKKNKKDDIVEVVDENDNTITDGSNDNDETSLNSGEITAVTLTADQLMLEQSRAISAETRSRNGSRNSKSRGGTAGGGSKSRSGSRGGGNTATNDSNSTAAASGGGLLTDDFGFANTICEPTPAELIVHHILHAPRLGKDDPDLASCAFRCYLQMGNMLLERSDRFINAIRIVEKYFQFTPSIIKLVDRVDPDDLDDLIIDEYAILKKKLEAKAKERARLGKWYC